MKSNPEALRAARERRGHTGKSLGETAKVSQQRISDLERAAVPILPTTAKRLADALEVEITDIATIEDDAAEVAS